MTKKPEAEKGVEDLVQRALVPIKEQPYKVPGNWAWVRLNILYRFIDYRGKTPPKTEAGIPLVTAKNVKQGYIDYSISEFISREEYLDRQTRGVSKKGDILITTEAPLGNVALANLDEFSAGQRLITLQKYPDIPALCNPFYAFYMLSDYFLNDINNRKTGTTVAGIKAEKLKQVPIPVSPFPEQQRIVNTIESLFAKLDRAHELLEEVQDAFQEQKATILARAFRGELTARWREERGLRLEKEWKTDYFGSVASIKSNLVPPEKYGEYPHIAPDNIEKKTGKLIGFNTISEDGMTSAKHLFFAGQILYSKIRPYLSKLIIAEFDGLCSADMYPIETVLETKYLYYYMLSEEFLTAASTAGSRSVLPKINQKELNSLPVVFPSNSEQREIVRILDDLLDKSSAAASLCDQIDQIDQLKKTILAKAFRGELNTNDPSEDGAEKLLREVLRQRMAVGANKASAKRKG